MRVVLAGPPNSGKSTIFNAVAGYKTVSSNFSGTTVRYTESRVRINGMVAGIVDFPGCHCLSSDHEIERQIRDYLISEKIDVLINILDASQLECGLPLTLELLEYDFPVILGLNMIDQAEQKGFSVNSAELSTLLGIPVVETVASRNNGIKELFEAVREVSHQPVTPRIETPAFQQDVEHFIGQLSSEVERISTKNSVVSSRYIAMKLLEGDAEYLTRPGYAIENGLAAKANICRTELSALRGKPADTVMMLERNALAGEISGRVREYHSPQYSWREKLDDLLMHPVWGYLLLIAVMVGLFYAVFGIGSMLETPLLEAFHSLRSVLSAQFGESSLLFVILDSGLSGVSGGLAIVLPYLVPFLIGLTLLEDVGYLPRIAFLMDSFMHRIGLHGTAVVPAILGYGCSVPAVMATRILPAKRDKIIAGTLVTLVPCSARSIIILGLVAYYLGVPAALGVYLLNLIVIGITGRILSGLMPRVTPGMIMELPTYKIPLVSSALKKVWFRIREFVVIAWPLLIVGSIVLGIAEYFHWEVVFNQLLSPLTVALGLPAAVGTTLIFGVLRKELALIMLVQALGTTEILTVLSAGQVMTFTIFVTFYIPCLATVAVLYRELGIRWAIGISIFTLVLATALALLTRVVFM